MCLYPRYLVRFENERPFFVGREERSRFFTNRSTGEVVTPIPVKCGRCLECMSEYSREWSFRIMDEARKHRSNCCVTLTYNDQYLPSNGSLVRADYQKFLKILRKRIGSFRYFLCGEYGSKFWRPHYHIILFGVDLQDLTYWCRSKSGDLLYRSALIEDCWSFKWFDKSSGSWCSRSKGFSYVGQLTLATARYCAKYLQKYHFSKAPREGLLPPFTAMSLRPGIGGSFEDCLSTDKLYIDGSFVKTPRYYLVLAERAGFDISSLKEARKSKAYLFDLDDKTLRRRRRRSLKLLTDHSIYATI